jgi:hypothetical protein
MRDRFKEQVAPRFAQHGIELDSQFPCYRAVLASLLLKQG